VYKFDKFMVGFNTVFAIMFMTAPIMKFYTIFGLSFFEESSLWSLIAIPIIIISIYLHATKALDKFDRGI